MTSSATVPPVRDDLLRVAVAAYLTRYKGLSRYHTESDLRDLRVERVHRQSECAQRPDVLGLGEEVHVVAAAGQGGGEGQGCRSNPTQR
jgi:hypothetical protein